MKKIAWSIIPFILMMVYMISPPPVFAEEGTWLSGRVHNSDQFKELSDFQREAAVLDMEKPLRLQRSMIEFRSLVRTLLKVDHARFRWFQENGFMKQILFSPNQETLEAYIGYLLPHLDNHLEFLITKCEENEKNVGKNASGSVLPDDQLFQTLTHLSILYSQIGTLYDYRYMVMGDIQAILNEINWANISKADQLKSEIADWLQKRDSLHKQIFVIKVEIDKEENIHQSVLLVLEKLYSQNEIQEEIDYYKKRQKQFDDLIQSFEGPKNAPSRLMLVTVQKLIKERLGSLVQQLPADKDYIPLPNSSILAPLDEESMPAIHPLISEWSNMKKDLIQSINHRSAKLNAMAPIIKARNKALKNLLEMVSSDPTEDFPVQDFLIKREEELLKLFSTLLDRVESKNRGLVAGERHGDSLFKDLAKIGIVMEVLYPIDMQILASMEMFFEKIRSSKKFPAEKLEGISRELGKVGQFLKKGAEKDFRDFAELTDIEGAIWSRFDEFVIRIVDYRPKVWIAWQSALDAERDGYDQLGVSLKGAVDTQKIANEEDSKIFIDLSRKIKNDPIVKILYGRNNNRSWIYSGQISGFVHQTISEIINEDLILKNLRISSDLSEKGESRAIALLGLVNPLILPWSVMYEDERLDLTVKINDRSFVIKNINQSSQLNLSVSFQNQSGWDSAFWDFILQPKPISGQNVTSVDSTSPSVNANIPTVPQQPSKPGYVGFYLCNQVIKNQITYGILAMGAAAGYTLTRRDPVARGAMMATVKAAALTQVAIDTTMAGGHMAADRKIKDPQLRNEAHTAINRLETVVYGAQIYRSWTGAQKTVDSARQTVTEAQAQLATGLARRAEIAAESDRVRAILERTPIKRLQDAAAQGTYTIRGATEGGKGFYPVSKVIGYNERAIEAARQSEAAAQKIFEAYKNVKNIKMLGSTMGGPAAGEVVSVASSGESVIEGSPAFAEVKSRQEQDFEDYQKLQEIKRLQAESKKNVADPVMPEPPVPQEIKDPPVVPPEDKEGSGEGSSVTTGLPEPQEGDPSKGPTDPATNVPADATTSSVVPTVETTGPAADPTSPTTNPDLVSQLRDAENQTNRAASGAILTGAPSSGGDTANLQLALGTNVTGSVQQNRDQQSRQEAQQALESMGGAQAERVAADQNRQAIDQSRVQAQGQQTNQAIAANAQEVVAAQQILQTTRQNSLGNILLDAFMGGITSGTAVGIDRFGSIVGSAAGQQASGNWGIQTPPPPVIISPPQTGTGSTGSQTGGLQTGSASQTTTQTTTITPPTTGTGSSGSGTQSGTRTTTQTAGTSSGGTTTISRPPVKPPSTGGSKSCRVAGTCYYTGYADKNGCCTVCGKKVAKK